MASNSSSTLFAFSPNQVSIFEGENYPYWCSQMQTFFESMYRWEMIDGEFQELDKEDVNYARLQKDLKRKDAMTHIFNKVSRKQIFHAFLV